MVRAKGKCVQRNVSMARICRTAVKHRSNTTPLPPRFTVSVDSARVNGISARNCSFQRVYCTRKVAFGLNSGAEIGVVRKQKTPAGGWRYGLRDAILPT